VKLTQILYYQTVCKHGNITKAAEELHITQPSISNAIKDLEEEFGLNLFHRVGNHLMLTKEGEYFLSHSKVILQKSEDLVQQMKDLGNKKNNIRIGIPPMIGTILFPKMFSQFKKANPDINIEMVEMGSLEIMQLVEENSLDLAIVITSHLKAAHFNCINILDTEIIYAVSKDHRLAGEKTVSIEMIKDEPLILMRQGSFQNSAIRERFKEVDTVPKVILFANQLYTIHNFITSGIASSFLFKEVVDLQEDIIGIPLQNPINVKIGLIWKKNQQIFSDASRFIQFTKGYNNTGNPGKI